MQQLLHEFFADKIELPVLEDPTSSGAEPIHSHQDDAPTLYVIQRAIGRTYVRVLIIKVGQCRWAESGMGPQSRPGPLYGQKSSTLKGRLKK